MTTLMELVGINALKNDANFFTGSMGALLKKQIESKGYQIRSIEAKKAADIITIRKGKAVYSIKVTSVESMQKTIFETLKIS